MEDSQNFDDSDIIILKEEWPKKTQPPASGLAHPSSHIKKCKKIPEKKTVVTQKKPENSLRCSGKLLPDVNRKSYKNYCHQTKGSGKVKRKQGNKSDVDVIDISDDTDIVPQDRHEVDSNSHSNKKHVSRNDPNENSGMCRNNRVSDDNVERNSLSFKNIKAAFNVKSNFCIICGKVFSSLSDLKQHLLSHSNKDKQHKCEMCQERFSDIKELNCHEREHTCKNNFSAKESSLQNPEFQSKCDVSYGKGNSKLNKVLSGQFHEKNKIVSNAYTIKRKFSSLNTLTKSTKVTSSNANLCIMRNDSGPKYHSNQFNPSSSENPLKINCTAFQKRRKTNHSSEDIDAAISSKIPCKEVKKSVHSSFLKSVLAKEKAFETVKRNETLLGSNSSQDVGNTTSIINSQEKLSDGSASSDTCKKSIHNIDTDKLLTLISSLPALDSLFTSSTANISAASTSTTNIALPLPISRSKPYSCPICLKGMSKKHVRVHMRLHNADNPYNCKLCNKSYITAHSLKRHTKKVHECHDAKSNSAGNQENVEKIPEGAKSRPDTEVIDKVFVLKDHLSQPAKLKLVISADLKPQVNNDTESIKTSSKRVNSADSDAVLPTCINMSENENDIQVLGMVTKLIGVSCEGEINQTQKMKDYMKSEKEKFVSKETENQSNQTTSNNESGRVNFTECRSLKRLSGSKFRRASCATVHKGTDNRNLVVKKNINMCTQTKIVELDRGLQNSNYRPIWKDIKVVYV